MTYQSTVLADNPTAYWPLSAGTVADSSGNGYTGAYDSTVTLGATAIVTGDTSATLPGVLIPPTPLPTGSVAWSVEFWYHGTPAAGQCVFWYMGDGSTTAGSVYISRESGGTFGVGQAGNTPLLTGGSFASNTDAYICVTYNGTVLTIYINGSSVGTLTTSAFSGLAAGSSTVGGGRLGSYLDGALPLSGNYAHLAIYSAALSSARVLAHYNAKTSGYAAAVLADSPAAYYKLNQTVGTALGVADLGSGNTTASYVKWLTINAPGILIGSPDKAVRDNLGGYASAAVNSSTSPGGGSLSVEAWIKPSAIGAQMGIVESYGSTGYALRVQPNGKILFFSDVGNNINLSGATVLSAGTVYHVVGVLDHANNLIKVYVNGAQDASASTANAAAGSNNGTVQIGGRGDDGSNRLNGSISEVAIYNTALSAARVLAHYNAGTSVGQPGSGTWTAGANWSGSPHAVGTPNTYTVLIGGQVVNVNAGTLSVQNQIGQRSTGSLQVWTPLGTFWQYGTHVQMFDETNHLVYAGFVVKDKVLKSGARLGQGYLEHSLTLMDNAYRADKRKVFKTYLNQSAGSIVNDLLGSYLAQEGVTATSSSIAAGPTITEVIWSGNKSVSDALTWLAQQAGYWWQIDVNNTLHFQPYGGLPAPFVLDGTQVEAGVAGGLSVEFGNDMYVNKQYTKGAFAETGVLTETFHGDSNKRGFTLSYPVNTITPTSKHPTLGVTLNGVAQVLGTKGSTGQPWYFAKGDAVLAQDPSQTVLTSGDTLVATYTGRYPVLAVAANPALIAAQKAREGAGSSGIVESTYANTKVHTLAAAFQIASALLSHYGSDSVLLEFDTRTKGLQPGQMLRVNLSDFGLTNNQMLISSVTLSDQFDGFSVWFHVQCVGAAVESSQWQTYWQNLMNQSSDPSDFTDTQDTAVALLLPSTVTRSPSATVTLSKYSCPICSNATICGNSTIIC